MQHSTGKPTKDEAQWMDDFRLIGCVACYLLGRPDTPYDVHHQLDGGKRIGHFATVPLCPAHHRGVQFVKHVHLASIAIDQSEFRRIFGEDYELRCTTSRLLQIKYSQHGLLPRRGFPTEADAALQQSENK